MRAYIVGADMDDSGNEGHIMRNGAEADSLILQDPHLAAVMWSAIGLCVSLAALAAVPLIMVWP